MYTIGCSGRKKAALTYVATYTFGCFTKHWNNFRVLLLGRVFCGIATSLLYSAFESWLVAEHFKVILSLARHLHCHRCLPCFLLHSMCTAVGLVSLKSSRAGYMGLQKSIHDGL